MEALKEVGKFVARIVVLLLPFIATMLADGGNAEWGGLVSAILVVLDKYIHESEAVKLNGLLPF